MVCQATALLRDFAKSTPVVASGRFLSETTTK
jgi:hypothetical protein